MQPYALPEMAPDATGQLYNLQTDPGETTNLFFKEEAKRNELQQLLGKLKTSGRSAPRDRKPIASR
jgi:arylsulfatase A